ncbi:MAG: hypothetical protein ABI600_02375 [Luteolibacter sp.]
MRSASRVAVVVFVFVTMMFVASKPAFAQVDLTGVWNPNIGDEDNAERLQGPSLVEFVGLPINDQARVWGLSYRSSRLTLSEHQCQVHVVEYIHRGPHQIKIWEERDPVTFQLIAIHEYVNTYEQSRTIWMDGRPHPSEYAPHTWMGFSTGVWEGNMLTVTTTHIKQGWHRRSNIPASDEVTVMEHYVKHGDALSHTSVTEDPIYLAEPLIKSEDYSLVANPNTFNPYWPCEYTDEGEFVRGAVPSYFSGENPYVAQYAAEHNLPQSATLGGAETMYPEFRNTMKTQPKAVYPPVAAPAAPAAPRGGGAAPTPPPGGARGGRGQ